MAIVQPINPLELPDWDALVANHSDSSFFYSAAWARVLAETYNFSPKYFVAMTGGKIQSLLAVMEVNSWLTGRRGGALPFTDYCEPICAGPDSFRKMFESVLEYGRSRGWKSLECRGGGKFFDGAPPAISFYGHCLDLNPGEDKLFERLESSVRRAIRKAEKKGVTVEIQSGMEALQVFYRLQCKTRKKHGLPPQPFSFFLNIHKHILSHNLGTIVLARYKNAPIAGSVYFHLAGRAIYKFGASDERFQHLRGSNLVMWEGIKWCLRNGIKQLHLGKTSIASEGLRRFKLGWGATEEKMDFFKYDLRTEQFVAETDEAFGWHNRVFRMLPIFASRIVGNLLYKHWA